MGEYEDAYPDAYGRREETAPRQRPAYGWGLPRQVRDAEPVIAAERSDAASVPVVDIDAERTDDRVREPQPVRHPMRHPVRHIERPREPLVRRTPRELQNDVAQALAESPFIDASDISVAVSGAEVTLQGTINSLIAISLAQALTSNVPGVGRVQVRLRVRSAPRTYAAGGAPVYKIDNE
ncbi:MAG TPA: BON domain-containing protein [Stellaceae bacterium]|nr:BON domain-containing protein [Stellaceae bacterium]